MFTVLQTEQFRDWLDGLRDVRAQARIAARLRLAEAGNLGDWKSVGGEVSEMRVDVGPGYRLYFARRHNRTDHHAGRRRQVFPDTRHQARSTHIEAIGV